MGIWACFNLLFSVLSHSHNNVYIIYITKKGNTFVILYQFRTLANSFTHNLGESVFKLKLKLVTSAHRMRVARVLNFFFALRKKRVMELRVPSIMSRYNFKVGSIIRALFLDRANILIYVQLARA